MAADKVTVNQSPFVALADKDPGILGKVLYKYLTRMGVRPLKILEVQNITVMISRDGISNTVTIDHVIPVVQRQ